MKMSSGSSRFRRTLIILRFRNARIVHDRIAVLIIHFKRIRFLGNIYDIICHLAAYFISGFILLLIYYPNKISTHFQIIFYYHMKEKQPYSERLFLSVALSCAIINLWDVIGNDGRLTLCGGTVTLRFDRNS